MSGLDRKCFVFVGGCGKLCLLRGRHDEKDQSSLPVTAMRTICREGNHDKNDRSGF